MIYLPILVVAYTCGILVAAIAKKKYQRAILWTGALIPFFSILLLIGLGLYKPDNFSGLFGVFLALGCSGLMACMAERQFPTRLKVQNDQSTNQNQSSESEEVSPLNKVKLPAKLDTQLARDVFSKAIEAGLMKENGNHYKWLGTKVQLAYMCGRIYCEDSPQNDQVEDKDIWKFGRTEFFPDSDLNELFEVTDLAQSRQNRKDSPVPQGSNKINVFFE
jgi:hypothetical protein